MRRELSFSSGIVMATGAPTGQVSSQTEADKARQRHPDRGPRLRWRVAHSSDCGLGIVAVLIFSATQFQLRFSNFVVDGGSLSIWKAEQLRAQWRASREASRPAIEQAKNALK